MSDVLLWVNHEIHDNYAKKYEMTGEIDPKTGDQKLISISRVSQPNTLVFFPEEQALRLTIKPPYGGRAAARFPTEQEFQLWGLANRTTTVDAAMQADGTMRVALLDGA